MLLAHYFGDNRLDLFRAQSTWSAHVATDRLVEPKRHMVGIAFDADSVCRFD
jgi:hypothetical protein